MKSVLVTGCSGGIGEAICRKFKRKGWYVYGLDINKNYNSVVIDRFFYVDLRDENHIQNAIQNIHDLHCLVNNAAYSICKPFDQTTGKEFKRVLSINVVAPFILSKLCKPLLKVSKGCIINLGSVHATNTSDEICAYGCSKAAVVGLTRNLAIELGNDGIRVNSVSPGAVDTPMLRANLVRYTKNVSDLADNGDRLVKELGEKQAAGRVGKPVEIADMVYFLANNQKSGYITGSNFVVDGGATVRLSIE